LLFGPDIFKVLHFLFIIFINIIYQVRFIIYVVTFIRTLYLMWHVLITWPTLSMWRRAVLHGVGCNVDLCNI